MDAGGGGGGGEVVVARGVSDGAGFNSGSGRAGSEAGVAAAASLAAAAAGFSASRALSSMTGGFTGPDLRSAMRHFLVKSQALWSRANDKASPIMASSSGRSARPTRTKWASISGSATASDMQSTPSRFRLGWSSTSAERRTKVSAVRRE